MSSTHVGPASRGSVSHINPHMMMPPHLHQANGLLPYLDASGLASANSMNHDNSVSALNFAGPMPNMASHQIASKQVEQFARMPLQYQNESLNAYFLQYVNSWKAWQFQVALANASAAQQNNNSSSMPSSPFAFDPAVMAAAISRKASANADMMQALPNGVPPILTNEGNPKIEQNRQPEGAPVSVNPTLSKQEVSKERREDSSMIQRNSGTSAAACAVGVPT